MFNIFKKHKSKTQKLEDEINETLKKHDKELQDLSVEFEKIHEHNNQVMEMIQKNEALLRQMGYTDDEIEKIKYKPDLTIIK